MAHNAVASLDAGPLAGVHAVCVAIYVPALVAAARLRSLGATVTVVEPPTGNPLELICEPWYRSLTAGTEIVRVDLKSTPGRGALEALLTGADVLLTSMRGKALGRLGLAWPDLHARHPPLCHVAITGFAPPNDEAPGHDLTYLAPTGLLNPPAMPRTLLADIAGGERAALEVVALLLARTRGGAARRSDVSLADAALPFAAPYQHGLTAAGGVLGGGFANYGLYAARDGWVAVGALESHFSERLAAELGVGNGALDREALTRIMATRGAVEWERWATERDLPIAAVRGSTGAAG